MKFPSLFKTPKHRQFQLKTRYYNAEKEAFEERIRLAKQQTDVMDYDTLAVKDRIRQKYRSRKMERGGANERSRLIRIAFIALTLMVILYWFFKY